MGRILSIYDTHLFRETHGIPSLTDAALRSFGKAVLTVAGADGALSPQERSFLLGHVRAHGGTAALAEELRAFDAKAAKLTDHVTKDLEPQARMLLYTALRVARADGVDEREREMATRAAKLLRVDPAFVPALEGLLQLEDAVLAARIRLLGTSGAGEGAASASVIGTALENEWLYRTHYGMATPVGAATRGKLVKAVLWVAGADKVLSEAERTYALGLARALGAEETEVEALKGFDPAKARIGTILDATTRPFARTILYDALRVARADKVSPPERDAAARMAKRLELDASIVPGIEGLLGIEDALNALRIRMLSAAE